MPASLELLNVYIDDVLRASLTSDALGIIHLGSGNVIDFALNKTLILKIESSKYYVDSNMSVLISEQNQQVNMSIVPKADAPVTISMKIKDNYYLGDVANMSVTITINGQAKTLASDSFGNIVFENSGDFKLAVPCDATMKITDDRFDPINEQFTVNTANFLKIIYPTPLFVARYILKSNSNGRPAEGLTVSIIKEAKVIASDLTNQRGEAELYVPKSFIVGNEINVSLEITDILQKFENVAMNVTIPLQEKHYE